MKFPLGVLGVFVAGVSLGVLGVFLYEDLREQTVTEEAPADAVVGMAGPVEAQRAGFANAEEAPPETAVVTRVFDGLTVGLDSGHVVRYLGVRVPGVFDAVQCFGKEALVANEGMVGQEVRLEEDPLLGQAQDGAWVRYVWVEEGKNQPHGGLPSVVTGDASDEDLAEQAAQEAAEGEDALQVAQSKREYMVNERIIELGLGFPLLDEEMTHFTRMEAAARFSSATRRGLWGVCEIATDTGQFETQMIEECAIKGAKLLSGGQVYRTPECTGYANTVILQNEGEKWFCSVEEAAAAGFVKAGDCPERR